MDLDLGDVQPNEEKEGKRSTVKLIITSKL